MKRPLPEKLTERHKGMRVQIREDSLARIIRRCRHDDGSYTGAGGLVLTRPDDVFYHSGVIVSLGASRCLVAWPDANSNIGLWLGVDEIERA